MIKQKYYLIYGIDKNITFTEIFDSEIELNLFLDNYINGKGLYYIIIKGIEIGGSKENENN